MMWNRTKTGISAAAVVAAAAIAGGGVAVAHAQEGGQSTTPSATSTASPSTGSSAKTTKGAKGAKAGKDKGGLQAELTKLRDVQHAQWVSKKGTAGTYVTHDAIRGAVTAISSSSITVKAGDGVSQSYGLTPTTKITVRGAKGVKPSSGTAASVTSGATVIVTGTGTSSLTATRVVVPAT